MPLDIESQYNSPNFTPTHLASSAWGPNYPFIGWQAIAIHWWDTKWSGATYHGTISTLCNGANQKSAHAVVEGRPGMNGRAAVLISAENCSWANGSPKGNTQAYSIELNPLGRDEDYQAAGEFVAYIRGFIGDLPLVGHSYYTATQCPGDYDLARIDRIARSISNPVAPAAPKPIPAANPAPVPAVGKWEADPHWVMEPGENLTMVAFWAGVSVEHLAIYNGIADPNRVPVGMWIWPPVGQCVWIVDPGDTLSAIARTRNVSLERMQDVNGINDPNLIYPGMRLQVPLK